MLSAFSNYIPPKPLINFQNLCWAISSEVSNFKVAITALDTTLDTALDTATGTAPDTKLDNALDTALDTTLDTALDTALITDESGGLMSRHFAFGNLYRDNRKRS